MKKSSLLRTERNRLLQGFARETRLLVRDVYRTLRRELRLLLKELLRSLGLR